MSNTSLTLSETQYHLYPQTVDINCLENLIKDNSLQYALVYALDGVLWGKYTDALRWGDTPQQSQCDTHPQFWQEVRCFSEKAELHLWRADTSWQGRLVTFGSGESAYVQTLYYSLWGGRSKSNPSPKNGFAQLQEEKQGLRQVAPTLPNGSAPSQLLVKHIYQPDDDGQLQFCFACLAGLA